MSNWTHQCGICQGRGTLGWQTIRPCDNCDGSGIWAAKPGAMRFRIATTPAEIKQWKREAR